MVLVAACAPAPQAVEADPDWVSVETSYPRYLHGQRRLNLETTNHLSEALLVHGHVLVADHFVDVEMERDGTSRIPSGSRVDIQSDFGAVATCDPVTGLAAYVEYEYTTESDDTLRRLTVTVDPAPLDEIRDRECGQRAVREAVDIRFGPVTRDGTVVTTSIDVSRVGEAVPEVRVESMLGSVIFAMFGPEPPLLTLDTDRKDGSIPIEFRVSRCDPHVVSQSSKTWEFTVWVAVDDRPLQATVMPVDPALRAALEDALDDCMNG